MGEKTRHIYPEKKSRDIADSDLSQIKALIEKGGLDTYAIAERFGYSTSQIAAVKANMKR
jgi:hypothetical protein